MKDTPDSQASQSKRAQAQPQKLTYHLIIFPAKKIDINISKESKKYFRSQKCNVVRSYLKRN